MVYGRIPLRIAHISDIHAGEASFQHEIMVAIIDKVNTIQPDILVVAGDLTAAGYEDEYIEAAGIVSQFEVPKLVIPGNHDARNVGWVHFENYFGRRYSRYRAEFQGERGERLQAT